MLSNCTISLFVPTIMASQPVEEAYNCEFCGRAASRVVKLQASRYYSCIEHVSYLEKMTQPKKEKDAAKSSSS